ncbi:hypothetical protein HDU79_007916 [Rhizoclosmatium sp. JEL0117]|nr:hypothetical protein HDU79_007916 [Rhizoclosmatium sp. JEL0117]
MSSLPSKPVRFTAELHAVAVGKVKNEKLKNVKPIRLGFDACFYELGGGRSADEEFGGVSPYVGNVDVEGLSGLIDEEESDEIKKMREEWIGGWRVPPRGQIQVLVKNSVGTAVKCFLLPYDFRDMPPGTKTFLRQKCFVGKLGAGKERLRDAIHVHFQCTSRKRVYLTRQIRVVFGGKGVEGDEKGRVITEGPGEPKYLEIPGGATPVFLQRDDGKILSGREEILSGGSPSRRSFSGGSWLGGGGSLNGGSIGGFASATAGAGSIPRRSSLGVSMMQFAGVNLDHPSPPAQTTQRILRTSASVESFRRPSSLQREALSVDDDEDGDHDLFAAKPLPSLIVEEPQKSAGMWMPPPPSHKSSLSMALSMSGSSGSVSSSTVTSGATTPKALGTRSRTGSGVLSEAINGEKLGSRLRMEVLDDVRMELTPESEIGVEIASSSATSFSSPSAENCASPGTVGMGVSGNNVWSEGFR